MPKISCRMCSISLLEGKSFKEIAAETGELMNTLLSRKRYAVLALRERLQDLYDEFETTS
jgi:hypothetical protein